MGIHFTKYLDRHSFLIKKIKFDSVVVFAFTLIKYKLKEIYIEICYLKLFSLNILLAKISQIYRF